MGYTAEGTNNYSHNLASANYFNLYECFYCLHLFIDLFLTAFSKNCFHFISLLKITKNGTHLRITKGYFSIYLFTNTNPMEEFCKDI